MYSKVERQAVAKQPPAALTLCTSKGKYVVELCVASVSRRPTRNKTQRRPAKVERPASDEPQQHLSHSHCAFHSANLSVVEFASHQSQQDNANQNKTKNSCLQAVRQSPDRPLLKIRPSARRACTQSRLFERKMPLKKGEQN